MISSLLSLALEAATTTAVTTAEQQQKRIASGRSLSVCCLHGIGAWWHSDLFSSFLARVPPHTTHPPVELGPPRHSSCSVGSPPN